MWIFEDILDEACHEIRHKREDAKTSTVQKSAWK